ncbi:MAG: hypothetical protein ACLP01_05505 [Solirubrobacteraceae bacterium]
MDGYDAYLEFEDVEHFGAWVEGESRDNLGRGAVGGAVRSVCGGACAALPPRPAGGPSGG